MTDNSDKKTETLLSGFKALFSEPASAIHAFRKKVIEIDSSSEVLPAFQVLIDNHILSAPVKDTKTGRYTGFLDVRDLVSYVILCYEFQEKQEKLDQKAKEMHNRSPRSNSAEFLRTVLTFDPTEKAVMYRDPKDGVSVRYLSARNRFLPVSADAPISKVAQVLAFGGVARVPVVDKDGKILDILSQSALIHYIQKNESKLPGLQKTLEELKLAYKNVISVRDNDTALNAFQLINTKGLKGLAVVDKDGKIIGNTSASDLKLFLQTPSMRLLKLPIIEYLNVIRRQSLKEGIPVVCVRPSDTLAKTVAKLAATNMHRIFVVDDKHKPVGVVSLTDILQKCVEFIKLDLGESSSSSSSSSSASAGSAPASVAAGSITIPLHPSKEEQDKAAGTGVRKMSDSGSGSS